MDERILDMIVDGIHEIKEDMTHRFDKIDSKLEKFVTKDECKLYRKNCSNVVNIKKKEISIKRITAIGGVVTGSVGASTGLVIALIKLFL